jgi:hypothetical protein
MALLQSAPGGGEARIRQCSSRGFQMMRAVMWSPQRIRAKSAISRTAHARRPRLGVNLCGDPMWTAYLGPTAIEKQIAFTGHERVAWRQAEVRSVTPEQQAAPSWATLPSFELIRWQRRNCSNSVGSYGTYQQSLEVYEDKSRMMTKLPLEVYDSSPLSQKPNSRTGRRTPTKNSPNRA